MVAFISKAGKCELAYTSDRLESDLIALKEPIGSQLERVVNEFNKLANS